MDEDLSHPSGGLATETLEPQVLTSIPAFEGNAVDFTKLKIVSAANLECDDQVFRHEDIVTILVEARIAGIDHKINDRTGKLERIHTAKAIEAMVLPEGTTLEELRSR